MRRNGKKNVRNRAEFVYNRNGDNMNTLQEAREKINAIDAQMADLFEERMRTVEDVIQYKKEHQMQVLDPTREQAVIERNQKRIRDPRYAASYRQFIEEVMAISRMTFEVWISAGAIYLLLGVLCARYGRWLETRETWKA